MPNHVFVLTASAFILASSAMPATAQGPMMPQQSQQQSQAPGPSRGMMGPGMGSPMMMRMMFALMDTDGDGAISLQEFQAAHERIFRAMDNNKDGRVTLEEMQAFMQGMRAAAPQ
jgi:hypothetical protein